MWTSPAKMIRAYISRLADHTLFTTRQLLGCGKRAATDQALYRMVRAGLIRRLARGVFVRDPNGTTPYSVEAIARIKGVSFSRPVSEHTTTTWQVIDQVVCPPKPRTFSIAGRSSSFKIDQMTITFNEQCRRKDALTETRLGRRIRALWSLGRKNFNDAALRQALTFCSGGGDRIWLKRNYGLLPHWLMDRFVDLPNFRIAPADTMTNSPVFPKAQRTNR